MNRRIKKKKAKPIIDICKKIKYHNGNLLWYQDIIYFRDVLSGKVEIEDYNNSLYYQYQTRKSLYLIVKKALEDKFPIQKYLVCDINYGNDITIFSFSDSKEYTEMEIKITGIDFVIEHNIKKAIPYRYDETATTLPNMFPCNNCYNAIYVEYV